MFGNKSVQWLATFIIPLFLIIFFIAILIPVNISAQGLHLKKEIVVSRNAGENLWMQIPFIRERGMSLGTSMPYGSLNNADNSNFYDFENDGIPEIIFVRTQTITNGTKIEIYDGGTYNLKFTIDVDSATVRSMEGFGNTCVGFLDVDGDGVRELVGEFSYQIPSLFGGIHNRLLFIDARTGKIKYSIQGYSPSPSAYYPDGYDGYAFYDIDHDSFPEVLCKWHDSTSQVRLRIYGNGSTFAQPAISPLNKKGFIEPSNFPNPFTNFTKIDYYLPSPENAALNIFNSEGRLIRTLVNKKHLMGEYSIVWDGKNDTGKSMGAGQYYYQLKIGAFVSTKRMISLK